MYDYYNYNTNNNNVVVNVPVQQPVVYTQPAPVYVSTYIPPQPVYNAGPYVTLSQVPYTGLDFGPIGNFLYWAFIVLWFVFVAYLVLVKRVQNAVYRSLKTTLFGTV